MAQDKNQQDAPRIENIVVETTGDFMKQDVSANQQVEAHRPSLVRRTPFIQNNLDSGQLRVVDDEPSEDLTDRDVAAQWEKTGKFKGSKKVKAKVPEVGSALGVNDAGAQESAKDKTAGPTKTGSGIPPGSPQQPGESDEDYLGRLDKEKAAK